MSIVNILLSRFKRFKDYKFYIFPIVFFEIIYSVKNKKFFDEIIMNYYSKKINSKNSEYAPTPYFVLRIIHKKFLELNIDISNYNFIDFGCGKGRIYFYFKNKLKNYIGIDINKDFKKYFNYSNTKFISLDCKKIENLTKHLNSYDNNILYFFNPFDNELISNIIDIFSQKNNLLVLICCNPKINMSNYKFLYKKYFSSQNINIFLLKKT